MELHGRIGLIKYVLRITDWELKEAKEVVDAFCDYYNAYSTIVWKESAVIRLSLFVGKIKSGAWVLRNGNVMQEKVVSYEDLEALTNF